MTIVNKPTAELKPYDKNAKKHDKKQNNTTKGESHIKQ